jgi:hypothetical protein
MKRPRKFPPDFGKPDAVEFVSALFFPGLLQARAIFAEIAHKDGVDAAEATFNEVIRAARAIVPKGGRPKNPDLLAARMALVSFAELVRNHEPDASDHDIGRIYLGLNNKKRLTKQEKRAVHSKAVALGRARAGAGKPVTKT